MTPQNTTGITNGAKNAERQFVLLTGAKKTGHKISIEKNFVEVRNCTNYTINQLRPLSYETVAVHDAPTKKWYVIPAYEVVRLALTRTKGQHGLCPLENFSIGVSALKKFGVDTSSLKSSCLQAMQESKRRTRLIQQLHAIKLAKEASVTKDRLSLFSLIDR